MNDEAIAAQGLTKHFTTGRTTVTAVNAISFAIAPGATYGLIGPDGAGKTTTTRLLLGLLTRTAGTSSILGLDSMRDTYALREQVGYIAQQNALPADLTVIENIQLFAGIHGVPRRIQQQRIPELLAFAGLSEYGKR